MKVLKFGGTSVGSPTSILTLIGILKEYYTRGDRFTVVFSAFSKVTDSLIDIAKRAETGDDSYTEVIENLRQRHIDTIEQLIVPANRQAVEDAIDQNFKSLSNIAQGIFLIREVSPRTLDFIVSFGERNSAFIIALAMRQAGIPTEYLDARSIIRTDDNFTSAHVDMDVTFRTIQAHYAQHPQVQAVTGFVASTAEGITTTLGRGGSDYTAAILGAALNAEAIEIWTDVDGVLSADPRKVAHAFTLGTMTYREAMEMSHFGAKVIYPPTILPALDKNIPLIIKNTFHPSFAGTYISNTSTPSDFPIKGISSIPKISLITLQGSGLIGVTGVAARLFNSLARAKVNIVLITQGSSEYSITFAIAPESAKAAKQAVEKEFVHEIKDHLIEPLKIEDNLSVIAVVGENMRYQPGIAGRLFQSLGKNGVNIVAIAQGSSELSISIVVPAIHETKAINAIHDGFFLSGTFTLHLYMVGVGLIGSTLLRQIADQAQYLLQHRQTEIKIVRLANSKKMTFNAQGIDLQNWKDELDQSQSPYSIAAFTKEMRTDNLSNTIFIDNTASEVVASFYEQILDASICISTPNKVAASGPYLQYQRLKQVAQKRNVLWRYETNVGAGLPIINTLTDLLQSGDSILKLEGVLSGSMSFIFNNYKAGVAFSDLVLEAKQKGYTEPDPREDLSGADVGRKLVILAREIGLPLEASDVHIDPILPAVCMEAPTVEAFFAALKEQNAYFEAKRNDAEKNGKVLRVIATIQGKKATIGLHAVDISHPFYTLNGSDNMFVFTTERYKERPLVVRGPGAGAEVTAAGIFAEIISIGNRLVPVGANCP